MTTGTRAETQPMTIGERCKSDSALCRLTAYFICKPGGPARTGSAYVSLLQDALMEAAEQPGACEHLKEIGAGIRREYWGSL